MIVCHCKALNDVVIRSVIEQAARSGDGACSVDEVGRRCGAGTDCGGCREVIAGMCPVVASSIGVRAA
jgi:bacterioferritin-associated ferredoxin